MVKIIYLLSALTSFSLLSEAQTTPATASSPAQTKLPDSMMWARASRSSGDTTPQENIIITKKGNNREKMTIVVDGDNITVNGRPVEEFEANADGRTVKVRKANGDVRVIQMPRAPRAPRVPFQAYGSFSSNRAFLGVNTRDSAGVTVIQSTVKKSPADSIGLKAGDRILSINGKKVGGEEFALHEAMEDFKPGDKVKLSYSRAGKEKTVDVKLGKQSGSGSMNFSGDWKDFEHGMVEFDRGMKEFDRQMGDFDVQLQGQLKSLPAIEMANGYRLNRTPRLGLNIEDLSEGDGVRVYENPEAETAAAKAGLKKDDVIVSIDEAVKDVDDVKVRLGHLQPGDSVSIGYRRNGQLMTTKLVVPKRIKKAGL